MKALILTADGVEDCELLYPFYRLQEAGIEVDVAARQRGRLTGKHGYTAEAGLAFSEARPADYDLLVIPGGKAPETVRLEQSALELTRSVVEGGKVVGAICHGAQVLISAGVLRGRNATCYQGIRDDLRAAGAQYWDEDVVVDGNLITSRCPDDLPAFCRKIMAALQS